MPDDGFHDALQKRIANYREAEEAAEARLNLAERELNRVRDRRIAAETLFSAEFGADPAPESTETRSESVGASPTREGPYTGLAWEPGMVRVLGEAGEPLHVKEIWRRLESGGFRSSATDPLRSVAAVAIRSPRLSKAAPNTYALVGPQPGEAQSERSRR